MSERLAQDGAAERDLHEALGVMAGTVAHDLNNILTAIGGNLSLLRELGAVEQDTQAEFIEAALQSVKHGIRLSEKMEAIAGRLQLHPEAVKINQLVMDVIGALPPDILAALEIRRTLSPGDPVAAVDSEKLRTTLEALAFCAVRAAVNKHCTMDITTGVDLDSDQFVLIRANFAGSSGFAEAIMLAFTSPYSSPVCLDPDQWNLIGVTGFIRQSGGNITLHHDAGRAVRLDILLPRWVSSPE